MSLDKAIQSGKEHRKKYRGSKAFDPSCRTNRCPWCLKDDLYKSSKEEERALQMEKEFREDG